MSLLNSTFHYVIFHCTLRVPALQKHFFLKKCFCRSVWSLQAGLAVEVTFAALLPPSGVPSKDFSGENALPGLCLHQQDGQGSWQDLIAR